jgi:NADH-quinone oxidoreductase subunit M
VYRYLIIVTLALVVFFSFTSLSSLYYIFDVFGNLIVYKTSYLNYYDNETLNYLFNLLNLNLILMGVYYFPFIYIFVVVTVLSILFCLSYSLNEMAMFVFYCTIIIVAGYMLFLADSLVLFFLAYELLLVPSFFILYKFAKTRRCIEAAYLMFFWTQFGALSLIFSLLYLFFMCETSSFYILSYLELSLFEINFLFIFWVAGFGVKLPI